MDLLKFIICELDIKPTTFCNTKILTYEIELLPSGNKIGLNLLDDEYSKIPYVNDSISNSPAYHQLTIQAEKNVWIIAING